MIDQGNGTVVVVVGDNATGTVTVEIDGENYTADVKDGQAVITLENATPGAHDITVAYSGDKNHEPAVTNASVVMPKYDSSMDVEVSEVNVGENGTVVVKVPSNATGKVSITVDGKKFSAPVENGEAKVTVGDLTAGVKTMLVEYSGDGNYSANYTTAEIEVSKVIPEITVSAGDISVGDDLIITVTAPEDVTRPVLVDVDGFNYYVDIVDGVGTLTIPNLNAGEYDIKARYLGDEKYLDSENSTEVSVGKVSSEFTISAADVTVGDKAVIEFTLADDATGTITATVNGKDYTVDVSGGKGILVIDDLDVGKYTVDAVYSGDGKYESGSNSTEFEVNKVVTGDITVIDQGNGTVVVVVGDNATGNVTVEIDGKNYTAEVKDGVATVNVDDQTPGVHDIAVTYSGDDRHTPKEANGTVTVDKYDAALEIEVNDSPAGEPTEIVVKVPENATGNVTIEVGGKKYTSEIKDGKAVFEVDGLTAGDKVVTATYDGDENYKANSTSAEFEVSKSPADLQIIVDENDTDDKVISVSLPDDATGYVILKVNDDLYVLNVTAGERSITIPNIRSGEYVVEANYLGDDKYLDNSTNKTFVVSKDDPHMNVTVQNVTRSSCDVNITLPEDATGTLTVTVDNETYTVPAKGGDNIVHIPGLTNGTHNITVSYTGDSQYNSDNGNTTVDIPVRSIATVIVVDSEFTRQANDYYAGERGGMFYAVLMDTDGNLLANKTVQIAINGPIYNVTTDEFGRAGLQVNIMNANTYTYALFFQGDEKYNASLIASSKLTVTKKATSISATSKVFKASAKTKSYTVTLKTVKNPYDGKTYLKAGKKIALKVGGKTYTAKINSKGKATFNIELTKKGVYTAKLRFKGDKTYKASKRTVEIKLN